MPKTKNSRTKIKDLGEVGFLSHIRSKLKSQIQDQPDLLLDDTAVIPIGSSGRKFQLLTKDMLIEGTHFNLDWISAKQLAEKSLVVNLSDIAAMGGVPEGFLIGLGLTGNESADWIEDFYRGLKSVQKKINLKIWGGDTTRSKKLTISITLQGTFEGSVSKIPFRKNMKVGDNIFLLGQVGESSAGLELLQNPQVNKKLPSKISARLIKSHLSPKPDLTIGQFISQNLKRSALIDLSDDLLFTLERLREASNVNYKVDLNKLPVTSAVRKFSEIKKIDPHIFAASGGEDYSLVLVAPISLNELKLKFQQAGIKVPIGLIGNAVKEKSQITFNGQPIKQNQLKAFKHF